jgi:hypothetical protein
MKGIAVVAVALALLGCLHTVVNASASSYSCRFAKDYTISDLLTNPGKRSSFVDSYLHYEAQFVKTLGLDSATQLTWDGHRLDVASGLPIGPGHRFSAASKESLHLALLAQMLAGHPLAAAFGSVNDALESLNLKLSAYEAFNAAFPGFGGFLPWYTVDATTGLMEPNPDWVNRVPSLDNGELFWAAYAVAHVLQSKFTPSQVPYNLTARWQRWLDMMITNAVPIFYDGTGFVTVSMIKNQSLPVAQNTYSRPPDCDANCYLDDPYEGELFTQMVYLFNKQLTPQQQQAQWALKRKKLQRAEFVSSQYGKITVQRGWWFSAHEQWKYLLMPYLDVSIHKRLFFNMERARTLFSAERSIPGLYASVNAPAYSNDMDIGYDSACGIASIAFEQIQFNDTVTPYGAMALTMIAPEYGLAWVLNMIHASKGQTLFGTIESVNTVGKGVSPLTTWDSKITTVVALLGGTAQLAADGMRKDGVYDAFVKVVSNEWTNVFVEPLFGEAAPFGVPTVSVPSQAGVSDFTSCN